MRTINMDSPNGVTLDTSEKWCSEDINVVPNFDFAENARRWVVELTEDKSTNGVILQDEWLKEHRNDEGLNVFIINHNKVITADNVLLGYYIFLYCRNKLTVENISTGGVNYGHYTRKYYKTSNTIVSDCMLVPLNGTGGNGGQVTINEDGGLKVLNTDNYPMQASSYTVIAWIEQGEA